MDIHLDTIVRRVEIVPGDGGVRVTDSRGNTFNGDKVCECECKCVCMCVCVECKVLFRGGGEAFAPS